MGRGTYKDNSPGSFSSRPVMFCLAKASLKMNGLQENRKEAEPIRAESAGKVTSRLALWITQAPLTGILEHAEPWGDLHGLAPGAWHPGPLPGQDTALGVRHHGKVTPIGGANARNAQWGSIGVQRVLLSGQPMVIHVAQRGQVSKSHPGENFGRTEPHPTWGKKGTA